MFKFFFKSPKILMILASQLKTKEGFHSMKE